jgi:sugar phosphate isomerase/epimerase
MKENIRTYAKIGLVHHLLYPKCIIDPDYHTDTLEEFINRTDIETLDCCVPYGDERRIRLINQLRHCSKEIVYALHLFPSRKISLSSLDPQEQAITRLVIKDQIAMAAEIGALGFVFVSGADVPDNRSKARESFKDFCLWFCAELKPYGIIALLEPFDREIDKKYLYGPIDECVELMDELSKEVDNIGIELDVAHLPLMGEEFTYAIKASAKYIKRVHLGNCIFKDKSNPLYGDMHPPIGIEGGEIDVFELKIILKALLEVGYLNKNNRNPLILEMTPFPNKTVEYTITESMRRLAEAWAAV